MDSDRGVCSVNFGVLPQSGVYQEIKMPQLLFCDASLCLTRSLNTVSFSSFTRGSVASQRRTAWTADVTCELRAVCVLVLGNVHNNQDVNMAQHGLVMGETSHMQSQPIICFLWRPHYEILLVFNLFFSDALLHLITVKLFSKIHRLKEFSLNSSIYK